MAQRSQRYTHPEPRTPNPATPITGFPFAFFLSSLRTFYRLPIIVAKRRSRLKAGPDSNRLPSSFVPFVPFLRVLSGEWFSSKSYSNTHIQIILFPEEIPRTPSCITPGIAVKCRKPQVKIVQRLV
jgi:hypothetical protein